MTIQIFRVILSLTFLLCGSEAIALSYEFFTDGEYISIHVLTIDPEKYELLPVRAEGEECPRETVRSMAQRFGAVAAVNGGFWKLNGDPAGILKIAGEWHGTPIKPRGAIGWTGGGLTVLIDQVLTDHNLEEAPSVEAIQVIPQSKPPFSSVEDWQALEHIVGGTPVLIRGGNWIEDYSSEQTLTSFLIKKHPRTAVGILGNGNWVFVVVDGRFFGNLGGMTMWELTEFMESIGCVEALNLGGGYSSTMVIEDAVVNQSCGEVLEEGKSVRAMSDAILVLPRN